MFERHPLRRCIGKRIVARIDNVTWHGTLAAYSCEWLELKTRASWTTSPAKPAPPA